jgi:hypothetical protein
MKLSKAAIFRIILFSVISLCFPSYAFPQEKVSLQDQMIGSTFKTLAKGFAAAMDIDKFKKDNIGQINKLSPDKYKKKYAKIYDVIKALPPELKTKYGIIEDMPREQVIKDIESLDKKKIYELINAIPNTFIAREFKEYLKENKRGVQESNFIKEINEFWKKISGKPQEPKLKN